MMLLWRLKALRDVRCSARARVTRWMTKLVASVARPLVVLYRRLSSALSPTASSIFSDICEVDAEVFSYTAWYDLQRTVRWSAQGCVDGGWHCLEGSLGASDKPKRRAELEAAVGQAVASAIRERLASVPPRSWRARSE